MAPTIYTLLGLTPNWQSTTGACSFEALNKHAIPKQLDEHGKTTLQLADAYKQLNAPFGSFGMDTLTASTKAIQTGSASSDSAYTAFDQRLDPGSDDGQRDALATQIKTALDGAAFNDQKLKEKDVKGWIKQAQNLIHQAHQLAGS